MKTLVSILGCCAVLIIGANAAPVSASEAGLIPIEELGKKIFFDKRLGDQRGRRGLRRLHRGQVRRPHAAELRLRDAGADLLRRLRQPAAR